MGGVWRTAKQRKRTCVGALRSKRGSCSSGGVWRTAKSDSTGYYSSHRRPPPASTSYCSSTVDLLQPPPATVHPRAPVHPASTARYSTSYCSTTPLHGLLYNHPSTGYRSSTPPPSTVHPALHHTMGSCSSRGNATAHCSSTPPPRNAHYSFNRSASVSSSSEGIARSG